MTKIKAEDEIPEALKSAKQRLTALAPHLKDIKKRHYDKLSVTAKQAH